MHEDRADTAGDSEAYQALVEFLYRAPVGLVQTDLRGAVEMMNPMAAQLLMPIAPSADLDNLFAVLHGLAPQLPEQVRALGAANGAVCDGLRVALPAPGGRVALRTLSISLQKLDGQRLMAMLSDATAEVEREQRGLARRLRAAARVDSLTQMPNREALREQLQRMLARTGGEGQPFAVLFMNCDRFKQVNDALGPAVGDTLLNLIAERLRSTLRLTDGVGLAGGPEQTASRLGGDEFVVVLDQLQRADDALVVAQRLVEVLSKPYSVGEHQLYCSISMGVVLSSQARGDADAVLQDASIAMGEAKRAGGGRYVVFELAMQQVAARRASVEAALRVALREDQLFVVYQPVVGLRGQGGAVDASAGVEALVRWRHPERGVVPPSEFITLAEETGLIGALGDHVLRSACHQFMAWQRALGAKAPRLLAVNLSRAQLDQPGFADSVRELLKACGMAPGQLQLEVTESLAAQDSAVQQQLHALKALGLSLALDDFGTGYSSLSSLHQFPVDIVKIDRSFTSQADSSEHHRVLIDATVRVARSLGMGTVAEGIETTAQAEVVAALGCDKGQGYLFSKPLEADALEQFIRAQAG